MMRGTWLVQRLLKPRPPREGKPHPLDKAHRFFGGGMLGLSQAAWDLLDPLFEIDYMGAAEYEFNTIPNAILELNGAKAHVAFSVEIDRKDTKPNPRRRDGGRKRPRAPDGPAVVYVLCNAEHKDEVEVRVRAIAAGKQELRDPCDIESALDPMEDASGRRSRVVGWFELNNAFFFFADEAMWRATCEFFGVPLPGASVTNGQGEGADTSAAVE